LFAKLITSQRVACHAKRITIQPKDMRLVRDLIFTFDPENALGQAQPERIVEWSRMQREAQRTRDKDLKEAREKKCTLIARRQPVPKKLEHFTVERRMAAIIGRG
jgi:hypothetical protein